MFACPVCLTHKSFQCSIEPLYNSEAKHVNEHIAHANPCQQNWVVDMPDVVGIDEHHHGVDEHAKHERSGEFGDFPETLQYVHVFVPVVSFRALFFKKFLFVLLDVLYFGVDFLILASISVDAQGVVPSSVHQVVECFSSSC